MSESNLKARAAQATEDFAEQGKAFAQRGADHMKQAADKTEAVAHATSRSMQESYSAAVSETEKFNLQWIEMMRDTANASLDFAQKLLTAKSPSEAFEVSAAHMRRQMETFAQQMQQLTSLAQKATTDAVKPIQSGMKNVFDKAA